mmetsp:Transcript_143354/g.399631  ORF Transcript_143354/g.399631 Transcript_143354/m.399631 type:complete len:397 (-) Transcript_143354:96-1286(-)
MPINDSIRRPHHRHSSSQQSKKPTTSGHAVCPHVARARPHHIPALALQRRDDITEGGHLGAVAGRAEPPLAHVDAGLVPNASPLSSKTHQSRSLSLMGALAGQVCERWHHMLKVTAYTRQSFPQDGKRLLQLGVLLHDPERAKHRKLGPPNERPLVHHRPVPCLHADVQHELRLGFVPQRAELLRGGFGRAGIVLAQGHGRVQRSDRLRASAAVAEQDGPGDMREGLACGGGRAENLQGFSVQPLQERITLLQVLAPAVQGIGQDQPGQRLPGIQRQCPLEQPDHGPVAQAVWPELCAEAAERKCLPAQGPPGANGPRSSRRPNRSHKCDVGGPELVADERPLPEVDALEDDALGEKGSSPGQELRERPLSSIGGPGPQVPEGRCIPLGAPPPASR